MSSKDIVIAPLPCREARIITARSYLIDRIVPDCEVIVLPEKNVAGGTLRWTRGQVAFPEVGGVDRRRVLLRYRKVTPIKAEGVLFDFRRRDPQNWAHFLNNHLPIFFHIARTEDLNYADCVLVLPANIPDYIVAGAEVFGLRVVRSDGPVSGTGVMFDVSPWSAVRAIRADWVRNSAARSCLQQAAVMAGAIDLPRRVFLSRRDTRALENEAEVADFLGQRGYVKIYPEDLSALDQFRLFEQAESIVAIHGAGIAPLLYTQVDGPPKQFIELLSCGHMTDVYCVMAQQTGWDWVGVRGRIKPEHISPAYRFDTPFRKYSLQSFEIDLRALERAFEMCGSSNPALCL